MELLWEEKMLKGNSSCEDKDYTSAFNYYFSALEMHEKANRNDKTAWLYNKLGICKYQVCMYKEALPYFAKAYDYSKLNGDKITERDSIYNIALTNKKLNNIYEAHKYTDYFFELPVLAQEDDYFTLYVYAVILKSNCYIEQGKLKEALDIYELTKDKYIYIKDSLIGVVYHNIAYLHLQLENMDIALEYFNKAESLLTNVQCNDFAHLLVEKSSVYIKQERYSEAIELLEKGIAIVKNCDTEKIAIVENCNSEEVLLEGYYSLEHIYTKLKEYDKLEEVCLNIVNILEAGNRDKKEIFRLYMKLSNINICRGYMDISGKYLESATQAAGGN